MNRYTAYTNLEYRTYDHLNLNLTELKPIHEQANKYLHYCAEIRGMSKMTLRGKECALRILIGECGIDSMEEFDNAVYERYVREERARGVEARTINTRTAHLIAFVKYLRDMGECECPLRIPLICKMKEKPARRNYYSREEVEEVLDHCNTELEWLLIKLAFDTGMRISEITNLQAESIHGNQIKFIGKGCKAREVYMTDELSIRLHAYMAKHEVFYGRVWRNEWGYPVCVDTIRRTMRRPWYACGHDDFYPHALRHSFGTDIQRRGADLNSIKEMMGHSNLTTTERYLHGLDGQLKSLFAAYRA